MCIICPLMLRASAPGGGGSTPQSAADSSWWPRQWRTVVGRVEGVASGPVLFYRARVGFIQQEEIVRTKSCWNVFPDNEFYCSSIWLLGATGLPAAERDVINGTLKSQELNRTLWACRRAMKEIDEKSLWGSSLIEDTYYERGAQ